jgi:gliding motility-associated-like protein
MKKILLLSFLGFFTATFAQQLPVNCNLAVAGCSTPSFEIVGEQPAYNTPDFSSGSISNPSTNPGSGNSGCLLSGETVSTFITINIVSNGTLAWSIIGPNGGCFDWIMWNVSSQPTNNPCQGINNNTLPPVRCNWNGSCNGNTGMAPSGQLPPGGSPSSYEPVLNVTAGQTFILCLSNYSWTFQDVNLNFFGTAQVVCGVSAIDQTICLGNSATVNIATPGYTNPQFTWLNTTGVSNPTGGSGVIVTPTVTTTYNVAVYQPGTGGNPPLQDTATFTITVVNPPAPNAGPDQNICLGNTAQLQGSVGSSGNQITWQVIVPPGMTPPATAQFSPNANVLNPVVTLNQTGTYKFILRENNATCGMVRDTMLVTVSELAITTTPTHPTCADGSDGQIAVAAPGANEYSINNGTTWVTTSVFTGLPEGSYQVCARTPLGCQKCQTVLLIDPAPVVVSVSNDTLICQNGTASMLASATGGTAYEYTWDHTQSTAADQAVNPVANTTYTVYATNENGCVSAPLSIDVSVRPPIAATITPTQSVCPGYPGTMTAVASDGFGAPYTYAWSTGTSETAVTSTFTDSVDNTTTYTVIVTDGCESTPFTMSTDIITHPLPVPNINVFEPVLCEPAYFAIENTTTPSALSAVTSWTLSDGQEYQMMDTIYPDSLYHGSYDIRLIVVSPEGCIDSAKFINALTVLPKPEADFRWSPDPVQMFNTEVLFTNYSTGADTYQWDFEGASPSASTSEDVVTMFPDGVAASYDVTLVATSDYGCTDVVTKKVIVMPEVLIYAPNAFTPDGDEFNQSWKVFMEGIDPYDFELMIYNRWGQVIWESHDKEASWDGTFSGQVAPAGAYTWTISTKDMISDKKYEFQGGITLIR